MGTVTQFAVSSPTVSLTFDDGPHPIYTPRLLDILEKFEAHATFFMVGRAAQRQPELVRQIAQGGHAIGNHSWDHTSFTAITGKQRREQIRACARATSPYGQHIFRPPWGNQSVASRLDALYLRYEVIAWSLEVGDWWDQDWRRMADVMASRVRPGMVILLHDAISCDPCATSDSICVDREPMLQALSLFLEKHSRKFRFATVPDMFRLGRPVRHNWFQVPPPA